MNNPAPGTRRHGSCFWTSIKLVLSWNQSQVYLCGKSKYQFENWHEHWNCLGGKGVIDSAGSGRVRTKYLNGCWARALAYSVGRGPGSERKIRPDSQSTVEPRTREVCSSIHCVLHATPHPSRLYSILNRYANFHVVQATTQLHDQNILGTFTYYHVLSEGKLHWCLQRILILLTQRRNCSFFCLFPELKRINQHKTEQ